MTDTYRQAAVNFKKALDRLDAMASVVSKSRLDLRDHGLAVTEAYMRNVLEGIHHARKDLSYGQSHFIHNAPDAALQFSKDLLIAMGEDPEPAKVVTPPEPEPVHWSKRAPSL